jgi:CheY-like chemotaxis protein
MKERINHTTILMADDDPDDYYLVKDALEESGFKNDFRLVADGEELMDYLLNRGRFSDSQEFQRPGIILLDLNMPRMDGREALQEIRTHVELKTIPVVVLTTSNNEEDVLLCYSLGASSYVTKPASFDDLVEIMDVTMRYWLKVVELPAALLKN